LRPPHALQHVFNRALGTGKLMRIVGVQYYISSGPVLWIEKRIASDYDIGMGPKGAAKQRCSSLKNHPPWQR